MRGIQGVGRSTQQVQLSGPSLSSGWPYLHIPYPICKARVRQEITRIEALSILIIRPASHIMYDVDVTMVI